MKKDEIYFGEPGITSTSANHLANKAKEFVATLESELDNISFVTTKLSLLDSPSVVDGRFIKVGITDQVMDEFENKLKQIAEAKSLCAWLREAIKAKKELVYNVNLISLDEWCETNGVKYPVYPEGVSEVTNDDYLGTLSVRDRNRYYELETYCSVFGKFIHTDGAYYKARKELFDKVQNPSEIKGEGHNTIVFDHIPSVTANKVEDVFFKLNDKHRSYQAEFNSMKNAMEQWVFNKNTEIAAENKKKDNEYNIEWKAANAQFSQWCVAEKKRINDLKIIIPNALQNIYETVNKL